MKYNKILFSIACVIVILVLGMFLLKDFNLSWVKVDGDQAQVTINFLLPMDQESLENAIKIENTATYDNRYSCKTEWIGPQTCILTINELSEVKGQQINLMIEDAPTRYEGIVKNVTIPIQFQSEIELVYPIQELLIATDHPFEIKFNTVMNEQILAKYLESDASFIIKPKEVVIDDNKVVKDYTTFQFTPKTALENDRNYILSFRKGMPSASGVMLKEDLKVTLRTDTKPIISSIIPVDGSKWIGLYPRIVVESRTPMTQAYLEIDDELISGTLKNEYYAVFYPPYVLGADRMYTTTIQIQSETGELSNKESLRFTTVPIKEDRIWIEVVLSNPQQMIVYKGHDVLKTITCSTGAKNTPTSEGTYYLQGKQDSYVYEKSSEGANYAMELTEGLQIHGLTRDPHWNIKANTYKNLGSPQTSGNIIVGEDDAMWLYNTIPYDTMVIIHK